MYPPVFLIHTITLTSISETGRDELGEAIITETVTADIPARLIATPTRDADGVVNNARCVIGNRDLPHENDRVTCNNSGVAREYWINSVKPIYEAVGGNISHIIIELRDTQEKVIAV